MTHVLLRDILINARQESLRMRHNYLGVEHLFIALLEIPGGLASSVLEDYGLTPGYVVDAIRRKAGKGGKHRLWAGLPNTPRADIVLGIANDLALETADGEIGERELMIAILEEADSVPIRVLRSLGVDLDQLRDLVKGHKTSAAVPLSYIRIAFGPDYQSAAEIDDDRLFLLRRMFHGYAELRVERQLPGGYSGAMLLVVTPIHGDRREDAPVVVKIDHADDILDEARRYEMHVKGSLPPLTARLEDRPTTPETSELAGLRYTFVRSADTTPVDLRTIAGTWKADRLGTWLQHALFPYFGRTWWGQRRPYRFPIWMEYDWLLPPILTLEYVGGDELPANSVVLKDPIKRSRLRQLEYGDVVVLENFSVQKVIRNRKEMRLALGHGAEAAKRAYAIDVTSLDLTQDTYYRGEIIDRLIGRVYRTRQEALSHAVNALNPEFDPAAPAIPGIPGLDLLPNPVVHYEALLDRQVSGTLSKLHGDLHLGNILVGPGDSPFLIDFSHSRDGHTLADWATLEISLLAEVVLPRAGADGWDTAYALLAHLAALNGQIELERPDPAIAEALSVVAAVRRVVRTLLAAPDVWSEYYVALAFCALRALTWETMSVGGRRLMFLVAALAMDELRQRGPQRAGGNSLSDQDIALTDTGESSTG